MRSNLLRALPVIAVAAPMLLAAAACTAPRSANRWKPSGGVETLPDGTKVICEMERPTGSHIPEPVCRRLDDVERAREGAQTDLSRARAVRIKQ